VFKLGIGIKTMCPNYILEFRNTISHIANLMRHVGQDRNCHRKSVC